MSPVSRTITCVSLKQDPVSIANSSFMLGSLAQLNVIPSSDTTDERNYHTTTLVSCTTSVSKCLTLICPQSKTERKRVSET